MSDIHERVVAWQSSKLPGRDCASLIRDLDECLAATEKALTQTTDEYIAYRAVSNKALRRVNAIRNSIVGFQTVNWSAHIYPLVAALNEAGYPSLGADEAKSIAKRLLDASGGYQDYELFLNEFDAAAQEKLNAPVSAIAEAGSAGQEADRG